MYNIPTEINSETKIFKNIYLIDMIFILVSFILTITFSSIVSQKVVGLYYIFSACITIFLVSKSSPNKGMRNYRAIYIMLIKSRNTYHSLDWNNERGL